MYNVPTLFTLMLSAPLKWEENLLPKTVMRNKSVLAVLGKMK